MQPLVGQLVFAALLMAGGFVLWTRGNDADRLADAQRALVTLQYNRAADDAETSAAAEYWSGNYAAVRTDADPLLAANASFRAAMAPGGDAKTIVAKLDGIVKQYAEVLRNDPANEDAAFNYEFVVRYRAALAARGGTLPPASDVGTLTPHGRAGAPPAGSSNRQFKLLVPMRPDERREAEEAGRSGRRVRKG